MTNFYTRPNIGKFFKAVLKKEIELPDGKNYYLFEDEFSLKHTLPKKLYHHYGFKIGDNIRVRLDHINCDNHLFFEPENPCYKEGFSYTFKFIDYKQEINYLGFKETIAIVVDQLGTKQKVRYASKIAPVNNNIRAHVALIKKGRLFLIADTSDSIFLKPSSVSEFKIIDTLKTDRFGETYVVIDRNNNKHGIPVKYYCKYNIKQNKWFKAEVQKISSKGFLYIEPEHPAYKIGKTYSFKLFNELTQNKQLFYFVEDCFGNIIKVLSYKADIPPSSYLKCRIIAIKKGTPILEECP